MENIKRLRGIKHSSLRLREHKMEKVRRVEEFGVVCLWIARVAIYKYRRNLTYAIHQRPMSKTPRYAASVHRSSRRLRYRDWERLEVI